MANDHGKQEKPAGGPWHLDPVDWELFKGSHRRHSTLRLAANLQCDESSQHWEEDGGTRGAYHNARLALHHALGRKPWDRNVIDCFEADPLRETNQSRLDAYRAAHELYKQLEAAAMG